MSSSLASVYPQARKTQYELKSQLDMLERNSSSISNSETVNAARQNLFHLHQSVDLLKSFLPSEPTSSRPMWQKKVTALEHEASNIKYALESLVFQSQKKAMHATERASLLSRRNNNNSANGAAQSEINMASQEADSWSRSREIVSDMTGMSRAIMSNLKTQRMSLQSARNKALDIANKLGLSASLLRVIERRDVMDRILVFTGMLFTLIFLYICVYFFRK